MWNAIQSDLISFVSTITDDTTAVVQQAFSEREGDDSPTPPAGSPSEAEKELTELKRSLNTYALPINRHLSPDYDAFCDSFSLTARASDIAAALQNEDDVSKFYEDLVPNSLDSEEFWKRYFYKVSQVSKRPIGIMLSVDDDDEENLSWDDSPPEQPVEDMTSVSMSEGSKTQAQVLQVQVESTESEPLDSRNSNSCASVSDISIPSIAKSLPPSSSTRTESSSVDSEMNGELKAENSQLRAKNAELHLKVDALTDQVHQLQEALLLAQSMSTLSDADVVTSGAKQVVNASESVGSSHSHPPLATTTTAVVDYLPPTPSSDHPARSLATSQTSSFDSLVMIQKEDCASSASLALPLPTTTTTATTLAVVDALEENDSEEEEGWG